MLRNNLLSKFPLSGITLKELNATMVKKKELSQIMKDVFHSYNTLAHIIEKDPTIADNIRVKILELLSSKRFWWYLSWYCYDQTRTAGESAKQHQKDGDFEDLENIAGTALAFFCLLFAKQIKDKKLERLWNIAYKYSRKLESRADTIDIMSNPVSIRKYPNMNLPFTRHLPAR